MSAAIADTPWTRQRWAGMMAAIFFAQVGLAFLFANRGPVAPRGEIAPITYRLLPADSPLSGLLASDPTLFVLPNPRDISPSSFADPSLESVLSEWSEPPRWLPPSTDRLGTVLVDLARKATSEPLSVSEKVPPQSPIEVVLPTLPLRTASAFHVDGDLKTRPLNSSIAPLPSWAHAELLADSIVELTANTAGQVVSARIAQRSGVPEADHYALQVARALHFAPLISSPRSLVTGRLVVQWHTTAPAIEAPATEAAPPRTQSE